jgi:hypothetical protein
LPRPGEAEEGKPEGNLMFRISYTDPAEDGGRITRYSDFVEMDQALYFKALRESKGDQTRLLEVIT